MALSSKVEIIIVPKKANENEQVWTAQGNTDVVSHLRI